MRNRTFALVALAAAVLAGDAAARTPVVVELYTAQGCGSCDKANAYAATLADRAGVAALTFNVDYWDYLGWKDTFAQPEYSDRQRQFDKRFGLRDVYTPQIVVEGEGQASGDNPADVEALIKDARRAPAKGPEIVPRADGTVAVSAGAGASHRHPLTVWLVRYDPRLESVQVKEGDNRGQTVSHRNVVRQLAKLGAWEGRRKVYSLPAAPAEGLATLILVQGDNGGRIVAAYREAAHTRT
ncbi:MAG TPA: DUF1223 domain-containing protein [Caulobacteraceae bacterium]|jgi:hypothetical protein